MVEGKITALNNNVSVSIEEVRDQWLCFTVALFRGK